MRPERFHRIRDVLRRRQPDLTVLMDRVNKSHNFSAIVRNCDAAGVLEVHAVLPEHGLDLHHATSAGTKKWVAVRRHADVPAAVEHLRAAGMRLAAAHPSPDAVDYRELDYRKPTALVMGAELHGVSETALALVDDLVTIPMLGMVHSLNVSVATALLLYEAVRQRQEAGMYEESRLAPEEFERRLFEWAYPSLARSLRAEGRPYPPLGPDGRILDEEAARER